MGRKEKWWDRKAAKEEAKREKYGQQVTEFLTVFAYA